MVENNEVGNKILTLKMTATSWEYLISPLIHSRMAADGMTWIAHCIIAEMIRDRQL